MKKILLIFAILLLSGCSVQYNLTIKDNIFTEETTITGEDLSNYPLPLYIDDSGTNDLFIPGIDYYDIKYENNHSYMKQDFNLKKYNRSTIANYCFEDFKAEERNGVTTLSTSKSANCFKLYSDLDDIEINVNLDSKYEMINNNADKVNNNVYTWTIDKNNYYNKRLMLSYSKKNRTSNKCTLKCKEDEELINANSKECYCKKKEEQQTIEKNDKFDYILIGAVLLLLLIIIIGFVKYKSIVK